MQARVLDLLFPPQCLSCHARVPTHGTLCPTCWQGVRFITEPCCALCGLPFEYATGLNALCGACLHEPPPFARARAAFVYDAASRRLVLSLKYYDQTLLAKTYGTWLMSAGRELIESCDVIVPVPLHYWRFVARRYNQSALLAQSLARLSQKPALLTALTRRRHTRPQAALPRKERISNVKGAFTVTVRGAQAIKGKSVLLVDDVMTTGATIHECTRALLGAGALNVQVLTLARTMG